MGEGWCDWWSIVLTTTSGWLLPIAVGVVLSGVVTFIWTRPNGRPVPAEVLAAPADERA